MPSLRLDGLSSAWRGAAIAYGLLLVWTLFWYARTGAAMVEIWARSETFTHGFIIPPIAVWIAWHRRHHLARLVPSHDRRWLWLLGFVGLGWLLGELTATNAVTQGALVASLVLIVPVLMGLRVTRSLVFALGFLFFAVPFGEFMMPQLMEWTADFTVSAVRWSGVPVYREGLQFVIPSGRWSVVEACSGVRYLIASVAVGTLFAYLNYQTTSRRVAFIAVSFLVPVLANWVRAYLIVMLGHVSGNQLAVGVDHLIYGWLFFGVVIMLMFIVGARWSEPEAPVPPPDPTAGSANAATPRGFAATAVLLAVVLAAPHAALFFLQQSARDAAPPLSLNRLAHAGWSVSGPAAVEWVPAFANPLGEAKAVLAKADATVDLYLGYYRAQNYERKLISSTNQLIATGDKSQAQIAAGVREVSWGGEPVTLRTAVLRDERGPLGAAERTRTVWSLFWINGRLTASPHLAKLYTALAQLTGRGDDSAVIVVSTRGAGADADARLAGFVADHDRGVLDVLAQAATK